METRTGKNHVESTNSKKDHYKDGEEYNETLAGSNLEVSFVNRWLWSYTATLTLMVTQATTYSYYLTMRLFLIN